jgi:hypothetical protein
MNAQNLAAGAEAFRRDNPQAEVHFYPTGHFALETHCQEIAATIRDFLDRNQSAIRLRVVHLVLSSRL